MLEWLAQLDRMERRLDKLLPPAPPASESPTDQPEGILDFQVRVSPRFKRANHFALYAGKLERAVGGSLRVVFAAPPQHGKSEVTLHGLAWIAKKFPSKRHAYITYNSTRARSVARKFRLILKAAGIAFSGSLSQIILPGGGQILFTSIDAGITGEPVDGIAVIDDAFKNRKEADSQARRDVVEMAYREAIETRVHHGGSVVVLATRWHPRDLSGILIEEGWEHINLPAIAEANDPNGREVGEALFPEHAPLEFLLEKKRQLLDFSFAALYQGRPRPKGGKIFHEPHYYTVRPKEGYRGAFGLDLSYTAKTSSDWSICVELWRVQPPAMLGAAKPEPIFYVIHVDREKVEAPDFAKTLKKRHERRKSWRMLWRASGTEKGSASFMKREPYNLPIDVKQPPGDKLVSATEVAAAWNDGRVLVPDPEHFPECEEWLIPFIDVLGNFTGLGKEVDDDADALGNAFEALRNVFTYNPGIDAQLPNFRSES
jgi:phage terminase large subunit-like protein